MPEKRALPLETQAIELAANLLHAPESRIRTSHTEKVWKYTAYRGGEPASMIDWKQSGKGREIYVRTHEPIIHKRIFFWTALDTAPEIRQQAMLVLLALAHILVNKEREVGWLVDGLPSSQTASQLGTLFATGLERASHKPSPTPQALNLHHQLVIFAADLTQNQDQMVAALKAYAAQGNEGILVNLGLPLDEKSSVLALAARKAQWPVIPLDPQKPADHTLLRLLDKTAQATR